MMLMRDKSQALRADRFCMNAYNLTMSDIIENGMSKASTRLMTGVTVAQSYPNIFAANDYMFLPSTRGLKKTSVKYAIAESFWYSMLTRDPSVIIPHARLWSDMVDADGNVESNYGYQLTENNDLHAAARHMAAGIREKGCAAVTLMIAAPGNVNIKTDTVCNNAVIVEARRVHDYEYPSYSFGADVRLSIHSIARSIDLMFGYPYDAFMLQGVGRMFAQLLSSALHGDAASIYVGSTSITAANMHVYDRDSRNVLDRYDERYPDADREFIAIPGASTGYDLEWFGAKPCNFDDTLDAHLCIARSNQRIVTIGGETARSDAQRFTHMYDCTDEILSDGTSMFTPDEIELARSGDRKQFKLDVDAKGEPRRLIYLVPSDQDRVRALVYRFDQRAARTFVKF